MAGDLSAPLPAPGWPPPPGDERERRRGLRRAKAYATALLAFAAALLVAARLAQSHGAGGWAGYLRAAAEAGIVGGLADWFAVTALFRRPLGLPIPHTAIIPTRKDALGRSLADFVGANFLSEPVVRDRIAGAEVGRRLGGWLARPASAGRVTAEAATAVRAAIGVLRDEDVQAVLESALRQRLARVPAAPALGRLLARIVEDGAHHGLVDLLVSYGHAWVRDHQALVAGAVLRQAPTWSPRFVDERVAARVHADLLRALGDIAADRQHPARLALDRALAGLAVSLREDPVMAARVDATRDRLLDHPEVRAAVRDLLSAGRRLLLDLVDDPSSDLRVRGTEAVRRVGERLAVDPALQSKVDGWLGDAAAYVVAGYRDEITATISETVTRWDAADTARKVELQVGRDLQFIRINGTVVGALAGVVLHAVTTTLF